jgi:hypothetical protein
MRAALARSLPIIAMVFSLGARPDLAFAVENQHHVGVGPAFSLWKTSKAPVAAGVGIHGTYNYGLSDAINLMGELHYARMTVPKGYLLDPEEKPPANVPTNRPGGVFGAMLGANYVIDVVRWVPYVGLLLGGNLLHSGNMPASKLFPTAAIAAGFDYQWSRLISTGFAFRQHFHFTKMSEYPSYSTFVLKLDVAWGY